MHKMYLLKNPFFSTCLVFMLIMIKATAQPAVYPAQGQAIMLNQLYEYMAIYEETLNNSPDQVIDLLYGRNPNIEVFNDLSSDGQNYVTWNEYRNIMQAFKSKGNTISLEHFNLHIHRVQRFRNFDLVYALVDREVNEEVNNRTINRGYHQLLFTLIYNRYEQDASSLNQFHIVRIERFGDSPVVNAWHTLFIPDQVSFSTAPLMNQPQVQNNMWNVMASDEWGFQASLLAQYRLHGKRRHALMLEAGLGFHYLKTNWSLDAWEYTFPAIDLNDNQSYMHNVTGRNISQNSSQTAIDLPFGLAWRYHTKDGRAIYAGAGMRMSYLVNQQHQSLDGLLIHQGHYDLNGNRFTLRDLPSYGFDSYQTKAMQNIQDLNPLIASIYGSITYSYPVTNHLNLLFNPYVQYNLGNIRKNIHPEEFTPGKEWIRSLPVLTDNLNNFSYGMNIGISFSLNNINKDFNPTVRFRKQQNKIQRPPEGMQYVRTRKLSPGRLRIVHKNEDGSKHRVDLHHKAYPCNPRYTPEVKPTSIAYTVNKTAGESTSDSLHLFKPYGFNIHHPDSLPGHNAANDVFAIALNDIRDQELSLSLTPLPAFNLFVFKLTRFSSEYGNFEEDLNLREPTLQMVAKIMENHTNENCGYYFYQDDSAWPAMLENMQCHACNETSYEQVISSYFTGQLRSTPDNLNDILPEDYQVMMIPRRRPVNLYFIGAYNSTDLSNIRNSITNHFEAPYLQSINFYLSENEDARMFFSTLYSEIHQLNEADYFIGPIEDGMLDDFAFFRWMKKKPVKLKNEHFYDLLNH